MICGGVTPTDVGKQYIEYIEKKYRSKVIEFSVRYKNPNWTPPYIRAVFENGDVMCKPFYETEYGFAFEHMKEASCYSCKYKGDDHMSDITIGDAWGLNEADPAYNHLGTSVAFVHTEKGDQLIRELKDVKLFNGESDAMKKGNPRYMTSKPYTPQNEKFKYYYTKFGLIKACQKVYSFKKRVISIMPDRCIQIIRAVKCNLKK